MAAQATALRLSIKQHPGGAQLLAESPGTLSTGALSLMERLLRTLLDAGLPAGHCAIAADTLLSHITGFVLQEQNQPAAPPPVTARHRRALRRTVRAVPPAHEPVHAAPEPGREVHAERPSAQHRLRDPRLTDAASRVV
ncbi:TetR/AcrR family transcriptional regulator C-terminal domain-containing protein [Streptomyces castrisilvae]|uniref:TetR/AcrR family transcriptional regulator C-terminal domain-containing protein n=1 Tax=Streptomyces castrisilvae TaxID=3033811 RepID=UPI003531CF7E